jgi:hypothetical protein
MNTTERLALLFPLLSLPPLPSTMPTREQLVALYNAATHLIALISNDYLR